MSEWQPIETAPRSERILVYGQPTDLVIDGDVLTRYRAPFVHSAVWDDVDGCFCPDGGSWLGPFVEPTHWMPLPCPPEVKA